MGKRWMVVGACVLSAGCPDPESPGTRPDAPAVVIDAAPPDGACATALCGAACCTPAQACETTTCTCPAPFVPSPFESPIERMDTTTDPPNVVGAGVFVNPPGSGNLHVLVIGFHPTDTAVDTDHDLAAVEVPYAGVGYQVNIMTEQPRAMYNGTAGTLRLTRRCAAGVAGTLTNVTVEEIVSTDDPTPIPGGCTFTIPSLAFDIGSSACP